MGLAVPEDFTVRRAAEPDVPALLHLLRLYFTEGRVQHGEDEDGLRQQLRAAEPGFYVAEAGGELVGCVQGRPLAQRSAAAECKRLYVLPAWRGLGIAGRLMHRLESEAQRTGSSWMYLDSKDDFAAAIALYRRLGYRECERFNDNPEATVFFRKRLTS